MLGDRLQPNRANAHAARFTAITLQPDAHVKFVPIVPIFPRERVLRCCEWVAAPETGLLSGRLVWLAVVDGIGVPERNL